MTTDALNKYLSPISFLKPDYIRTSFWLGHAPFAFWLMENLRPRIVVELGTEGGYSYFAFCQAVKHMNLKAHCHAVDTWRGDVHTGPYDEKIFQAVANYNEKHYADFSRLIRLTFDEALPQFADGSIDLLHIDGQHAYKDVKHDFESWRPKLSERAVVLFHDTNIRRDNYEVFKFWQEIGATFPSFQFLHSCGLGVLGYGSALPAAMAEFFETASDSNVESDVLRAYRNLGDNIVRELAVAARDIQIENLNQTISERDKQIVEFDLLSENLPD